MVENKGGMGGNVGADLLAKSAPDGYTLGLYTIASHAIAPTLYARLPFDAGQDFTAVSMLWQVPNLLAVRLGLPPTTVPELIEFVKASPGKYTFGSGGQGTSPHLCGEMLKQMAGLNMVHVPYRGGAPALQDLLAGQIDMVYDNLPGIIAQVRAGKVRPLAVTSRERQSPVAGDPAHVEVPARLRDHLVGRHLRPGRPAAGHGREMRRADQEGAGEREAEGDLPRPGRHAAVARPVRRRQICADNEARLAPIIKASGARVE